MLLLTVRCTTFESGAATCSAGLGATILAYHGVLYASRIRSSDGSAELVACRSGMGAKLSAEILALAVTPTLALLAADGDYVFFSDSDADGALLLYSYDVSTTQVREQNEVRFFRDVTATGDAVYLFGPMSQDDPFSDAGEYLWRFDPSGNAFAPIAQLPDGAIPREPVAFGGAVVFSAKDPTVGREIWASSPLVTDVDDRTATTPSGLRITTVFPSPASGWITVSLDAPQAQHARIDLFDVTGRLVATLPTDLAAAGANTVRVDLSSVAPGVYVVVASGSSGADTRIVVVAR